jgi:hypothetical protein
MVRSAQDASELGIGDFHKKGEVVRCARYDIGRAHYLARLQARCELRWSKDIIEAHMRIPYGKCVSGIRSVITMKHSPRIHVPF